MGDVKLAGGSDGGPQELMSGSLVERTQWLLKQEDSELQAIMNRLAPEDAAQAIRAAPNTSDRTRLIWSLEKPKRAAVVDHLPVPVLASMVQNDEARNRRLLSDISYQAFADLLSLCSPEQRYYWLGLANSYDDLPANLLPLLLPARALAEILMSNSEYRASLERLASYDPALLREAVPIQDPRLRRILETVADIDPEHYRDLIRESFRIHDYRLHHPEEQALRTEPLVLRQPPERLEPQERPQPPPESAQAGPPEAERTEPPAEVAVPLLQAIQRMAPSRRLELLQELERLLQEEVVALGGSYAQSALDKASGRLRCAVQMGMLRRHALTEAQVLGLLESTRASQLLREGHEWIEQIRQQALRLVLFREQLEEGEANLVQSLLRPDFTCHPETGGPVFVLKPRPKRKGEKKQPEPELVSPFEVERRLAAIAMKVQPR